MKQLLPRHLLTASATALLLGLGHAGAQQVVEPANEDTAPQISQEA